MTDDDYGEEDYEDENEPQREETLWQRTDDQSNGRWLYVDKPDAEGDVMVGIEGVYRKFLSPDEADAMALALVEAAKQGRAVKLERELERLRRIALEAECETRGGHDWPPVELATLQDLICMHCGSAPTTRAYTLSSGFYRQGW